jgi:hypothetical protein
MTDPNAAQPTAGDAVAPPPADTSVGADAAADILDAIDEHPLHGHPDAYGRIHAALHSALTAIDDA